MKQTAMQDLREDLILTQTSAKEDLLEIENQETRNACQEVVRLTLSNIIKRIDEELLDMEKQQQDDFAIEFYDWCNSEEALDLIQDLQIVGELNKIFKTEELLELFKNK